MRVVFNETVKISGKNRRKLQRLPFKLKSAQKWYYLSHSLAATKRNILFSDGMKSCSKVNQYKSGRDDIIAMSVNGVTYRGKLFAKRFKPNLSLRSVNRTRNGWVGKIKKYSNSSIRFEKVVVA